MEYNIEYYSKSQFYDLKDVWINLEKGDDMTAYQSYSWYEMLNEHYVPDDTIVFESVYVLISCNGTPSLIAPLWIVKHTFRWVNKKGIYFLGREGWSDYLNFIYSEFNSNALLYLLSEISKKYNAKRFYLSEMKEQTQSYLFLKANTKLLNEGMSTCVALTIPATIDDYMKLLSKNARQNIRTAYNRLKKDGIDVRIELDDKCVDRKKCLEIREQRFLNRFQKISRIRMMKYKFIYRLKYHFRQYLPFVCYNSGHFLTMYDGDELCSFFYYLYDKVHRECLVLAAGVNMKYSKYSPGIISLNAFINHHITIGDVDIIDFTRGDEHYKFVVGGEKHFIGHLIFRL